MKWIFALLFLTLTAVGFSQQVPATFFTKSKADVDTLAGIKNQPVLFPSDTVFILNRPALKDYHSALQTLQSVSRLRMSLSQTTRSLDSAAVFAAGFAETQNDNLRWLKSWQERNRAVLDSLSGSGARLQSDLAATRLQLQETRAKLDQPADSFWKSGFFWFSSGVLTGLAVVLLAR
ncbi:MAG: hypothetical protein L6Q77_06550 [Bacteroidetes bacterium]|nr:hypothetical protein [Bacteroidota bacterium]